MKIGKYKKEKKIGKERRRIAKVIIKKDSTKSDACGIITKTQNYIQNTLLKHYTRERKKSR